MYLSIAQIIAGILSLAAITKASNVIDLDPSNFDSVIGTGKPALVEFFAPWCGHCKNLAPIYEQLADAYSHSKGVVIAKVDADKEKELGSKYGVKGFPTLKWFDKDGNVEDYSGGRQLDDLAGFVTQKSGVKSKIKPPPPPAYTELNYLNLEETINDPDKHVLVTYTASWCGHCKTLKPTYEKVAKNFKPESDIIIANYECDAEPNKPLAEKIGIKSFPTIKFYSKGSDKTSIPYEGGRSEADLTNWLNEKTGTFRAVGGGLNDQAGRIAKLDELAQEFFMAAPKDRQSIYDTAAAVAEDVSGHAAVYLRVMEKVINGSIGYIDKESRRLASILQKRTLSDAKLDEIKMKANVLATFAERKVAEAAEGAAETVEEAAEAVEEKAKKMREEL